MQISATLIAAQQAAREARDRLQVTHSAQADFAAALEKESGFAPLPLKQTAALAATPPPDLPPASRPGSLVDIKV